MSDEQGRAPTVRQREILALILRRILSGKSAPSVREIGKFFGIRSPNGVVCHLKALARRELIEKDPIKSRGIGIPNCGALVPLLDTGDVEVFGEAPLPTLSEAIIAQCVAMVDGSSSQRLIYISDNRAAAAGIRPGTLLVLLMRTEYHKDDEVLVMLDDGDFRLLPYSKEITQNILGTLVATLRISASR